MSLRTRLTHLHRRFILRGKYKRRFGYYPNLSNPISLTEKIQYRKVYDDNPLFALCSDKYKVRDYVASKIGSEYLIDMVYVGDTITQADVDNLPEKFVIKTNHDSGGVWVVTDKSQLDFETVKLEIDERLSKDFGKRLFEPWYSKIERKVVVEAFLDDGKNSVPEDYKFHVFKSNGQTRLILQINYSRANKKDHNRTFYDEHLNVLPFSWPKPNNFVEVDRVENFDEMKRLAIKLAEDFNYVRVDFYNLNGKIYFGELTFAPTSGYKPFDDVKYDQLLGGYWELEV